MIQHGLGLLFRPHAQWQTISELPESHLGRLLLYPCVLAIIPAVAWFFGTTQVGWTVGPTSEPIKLTPQSAQVLCVLFYFGMLACVGGIGYFIHWMAETYGAESSTLKGVVITGLAATPLFLSGVVGVYPLLWLDMLIGVFSVSWSVYLMYLGIPIMMGISQERGFLFSSAVMAIALVILICLMVGSVILWDFGAAPAYTD